MTPERYILTLSCRNRPGIVARVATHLHAAGGNILEAQQFDDTETNQFFMRVVFDFPDGGQPGRFADGMAPIAADLNMEWACRAASRPRRVLILASKADHCLADLLYRRRIGELSMDLVGVVSNHPRETYQHLDFGAVAFRHMPIEPNAKQDQEARLWDVIQAADAELVVLARYMQILSEDLAARLSGRCINIHHSFLPGFKGARPYHQAHARGVKLIGATAHFVTGDLDEGPIIEQDVERISHQDSPSALIRKGRDIERRVLARAVGFFLEDRIFLNGAKCVVFRD